MSHDNNQSLTIFWTSVVIWLTVFATFALPGRTSQPTMESLDSMAMIKLVIRVFSLAVLGWIIFCNLRDARVWRIVTCVSPWIIFACWAIVSTIWSPLKGVTLGQAGGQVVLIFLTIVIAMNSRQGEEKFLFQCVVAIMIYAAVYGLGAFAAPDFFSLDRASEKGVVHPTALGATSALGIVLVLGLMLTAKWNWVIPISFVAIPVFLIAMINANNRLSAAMLAIVGVGMIIYKGQSHRMAISAFLISMIGAGYMVADPGLVLVETGMGSSTDFLQRGQSTTELSDLSGRAEMWSKMWKSYLGSPVIGHGYFVCSAKGTLYVWYSERNHSAHNLVLQALVSTGIVGLLLIIWCNLQLLRVMLVSLARKVLSPVMLVLAPAVLFWFLGWTTMNASILGPIRPESAIFAVITGLVIGQYCHGKHHQTDISLSSRSTGNPTPGVTS